MRLSLTFISLLISLLIRGQSFTYPIIKTTGQTISDFVPNDWKIVDSAIGDLNNDSRKDAALVLQDNDSVYIQNLDGDSALARPRILVIIFKSSTGADFILREQSNTFILTEADKLMEDPYQGITISKGVLKIDFQLFFSSVSWWATNSYYQFRFQNNQFYLIGAYYYNWHRATHDYTEYSYNFLTMKRSLTKGNDKRKKTTWKILNFDELKTSDTFDQPFTWNIEEEVSL